MVSVPPAVRVTDKDGAPVQGVSVTFAVTSGGGSVTGGAATTGSGGVATVGSWTLGATGGANALTATVTNTGVAGNPVVFSATGLGASQVVSQAGTGQTAPAGTAVPVLPAVLVTDQNGNPLQGISVTFAVTSGGGSVTGGTVTTGSNGVATVGGWTLGAAGGANTLTATVTGTGITGNPVVFSATGLAASQVVAQAGNGQSAQAGTAVPVPPAVRVSDQNGSPVQGISVTFAVTTGGGSVTGGTATTGSNGVATVGGWTLGAAGGANTLTATVTGSSITGNPVVFSATGLLFTQQGPKLVGTGAVGSSSQGESVALSADGNTAIVGGSFDGSAAGGAAWVWTRSGGIWTQQGPKLVGSGSAGGADQGASVSLSADGNTALVGGPLDNNLVGAAWVWTRSGGVWSQQGPKLVGTGSAGDARQGISVSLSADGNTAMVGGGYDNNSVGATWVWTRSGGVWTQQGPKLVGTGAVGDSQQGQSVSLSADGNTAIVGGFGDNNFAGAAWVWTRSGGVWTQQGSKLVGTGATGDARQGLSVSISADGTTAIVGGDRDNNRVGAAWVWTRSGGTWTQQGPKLVGSGGVGPLMQQGWSVTISANGHTAMVGGYLDNSEVGAVWVWTRSGTTWTQLGSKLVGTGAAGFANQGQSVSISADGKTAIVGGDEDNNSIGAAWIFILP